MKLFGASVLLAAGLWMTIPPTATAQVDAPRTSSSAASSRPRLPTLELVAEFECPGCLALAVAGNALAGLSSGERIVKVWDLASNAASQFDLTPRSNGGILTPVGVILDDESITVGGSTGADRRAEKYTLDGMRLEATFLPPTDAPALLHAYAASPSGAWALQRQLDRQAGSQGNYSLVRTNRATGASEVIDVPAELLSGMAGSTYDVASGSASAAISDDGTLALGIGRGNSYRLVLIPVDASPRIARDRALPPLALTQKQTDAIRRTLSRTMLSVSPQTPPPPAEVPPASETFTPPSFDDRFRPGALRFDGMGRLWISTMRGSVESPTTVFDLFSPALEHLGEVGLGEAIDRVYHIGADLLVARVRRDQTAVVKAWRIER